MKPDARPVALPSRKIPIAFEEEVKEKLEQLEKTDVIERCHAASGWLNPLVVVPKKNNTIRICVDLRRVNEFIIKKPQPFPSLEELSAKLHGATRFSTLE